MSRRALPVAILVLSAACGALWVTSMFETVQWSNGSRYLVHVETGAAVFAHDRWRPETRPVGLAFWRANAHGSLENYLLYLQPSLHNESGTLWINLPPWVPMAGLVLPLVWIEFRPWRRARRGLCQTCARATDGPGSPHCSACVDGGSLPPARGRVRRHAWSLTATGALAVCFLFSVVVVVVG